MHRRLLQAVCHYLPDLCITLRNIPLKIQNSPNKKYTHLDQDQLIRTASPAPPP